MKKIKTTKQELRQLNLEVKKISNKVAMIANALKLVNMDILADMIEKQLKLIKFKK